MLLCACMMLLLPFALGLLGGHAAAQSVLGYRDVGVVNGSMYMNPVLDKVGAADPWVIRDGEWYYMMYTQSTNITMLRSKTLTDWNGAESKLVYQPPEGKPYSTDLWAPEIHAIHGSWYVIFTADPNSDTPPPQVDQFCTYTCPAVNHRMYVLEGDGPDIWGAEYAFKGELETFDMFAIDGTYFVHKTGLYHVYSCWYSKYESWPANLCITKLSNPWTTISNLTDRAVISTPSQPWEKTPYGRSANVRLSSNEGPEQLTNPLTNQTFIIYSAARSDNPNYCLGQLALSTADDADPMNPSDWTKYDGCVFYQNKLEHAYGTGHASFVKSPDGKEDWIVYHAMQDPWSGWSAREISAMRFEWEEIGPVFPRPGYGPYQVPSGKS